MTTSRRRPGASEIRWLSPASLRLHAVLVLGLAGAAFATWFEWTRAHSGHQVAWVYTFELPLLAAFGTYLWWRLLHADGRPTPERPPESDAAGPPGRQGAGAGLATRADQRLRVCGRRPP